MSRVRGDRGHTDVVRHTMLLSACPGATRGKATPRRPESTWRRSQNGYSRKVTLARRASVSARISFSQNGSALLARHNSRSLIIWSRVLTLQDEWANLSGHADTDGDQWWDARILLPADHVGPDDDLRIGHDPLDEFHYAPLRGRDAGRVRDRHRDIGRAHDRMLMRRH